MKLGTPLSFGLIYNFLDLKLKKLELYLEEKLSLEFIKTTKLPTETYILFAQNKSISLIICVDYRVLNRITIQNHNILFLFFQMFNRV